MNQEFTVGQEFSWARHIDRADIVAFAELTGDRGAHHTTENPDGKLMAHGLLTASLPTKLGGDIDFVARTMQFDFLRPVFDGDTLTCAGTVLKIGERDGARLPLELGFVVTREDGREVMRGNAHGFTIVEDR
jgi:acyl dehydratase